MARAYLLKRAALGKSGGGGGGRVGCSLGLLVPMWYKQKLIRIV